jgi:hypothetical protein
VLAALGGSLFFRVLGWRRPLSLGLGAGAAWLCHVLLDYLGTDASPPIGLMALWPLSHRYFKFPWPIFLDIGRTLEWATVRNNAVAALWELCILLPPLAGAWRMRTRSKV